MKALRPAWRIPFPETVFLMAPFSRRWQSIDRKLPIVASGLVVLTAAVLGTTAYLLLERALLKSAGQRLLATAKVVAQVAGRPTPRIGDSTNAGADAVLRGYLRGRVSMPEASGALSAVSRGVDTLRHYAAILDPNGKTLLAYREPRTAAPRWPAQATARGEIRGDTASLGPFENGGGIPIISMVRPLHDTVGGAPRLLGYVVESRAIASVRSGRTLKNLVGTDVEVLIGQPGAGVWTDFERIAAAPPSPAQTDSIIVSSAGVGVLARVTGTNWRVWVSQPRHAVLAPARIVLWSMLPIGLAIALVGAAITWRMTRRITFPIVELTQAAENIAADNGAGAMIPSMFIAPNADEVARLRHAFERMARRVSERQTLEMQLRQSQKMEAIGQLAGGVAHDFNNLLTAIRSYADLLLQDMPVWDTKRSDVLEIRAAAQRAAALTAQLLAFSRKQMLQPRVLESATLLTELRGMLTRLLTEDIVLKVEAPGGLWAVKADRGQLEQVIVNLVVNARDAMPDGGLLHVSAANEHVVAAIETRHSTVPPGDYVAIRVKDSGVGMNAATQQRAFEPFFTTKPTGHGTGLGLATVHGIVAQSGGYVTLESAPQRGTTFTVWLPRVDEAPSTDVMAATTVQQGRNETILLVEDEPAVRVLARRVLMRAGFRVLESSSPTDALRLAEMHAKDIKLVLTDVVMPELSGPQLVIKVAEICPDARVLYMSGYTDDEVIGRGLANPGLMLLQKPFSAQELVERVRLALDQTAEAPA
jgi:signal transduction histidine kinase/ActR/RegA family two-component response regulator